MLCVTGDEPSIDAWLARVGAADRRLAGARVGSCLHELRLDALTAIDDATWDAVRAVAGRVVACCRPARQGGGYTGDEATRLELLARAAAVGVAWLDVEDDVPQAWLAAVRAQSATLATGTRILASHHRHASGPFDAVEATRRLAELGPDALKLAVAVDDSSAILPLVEACEALDLPRVVVAMGPAGLLTRSHYRALGSMFCYVAEHPERRTAPGQLDLDAALALRLHETASLPPFGLVGGEQVLRSPGIVVHNRLLRRLGEPASYVPIVTRSLRATMPLLERLGARGLAVTMPLKREAVDCCKPDALAREVGAVNSLRARGSWEGTNTDVEGVRGPLARHVEKLGVRRGVVLGSGGAARAAVVALRSLGLSTELFARTPATASAFLAPHEPARPWSERGRGGSLRDAALVNATPLGGGDCPWPASAPLDAAIVFDTALGFEGSALLDRAKAEGAVALGPLAMWRAQAARQMSWMLDRSITSDDLAEWEP